MTDRALDRQQAAELLGVPEQASKAEVQAAFRRRARNAHPDTRGSAIDGIDLDELARARDLLVRPPGMPAPTARGSQVSPRTAHPHVVPAPNQPSSASGLLWNVVVGGFVFLLLAVLVVVVLALVSGDDVPAPATAGDCVIVTDDVIAAPCDTASAQRVAATLSGVRDCPGGTNALTVGSVTWCLEPVG